MSQTRNLRSWGAQKPPFVVNSVVCRYNSPRFSIAGCSTSTVGVLPRQEAVPALQGAHCLQFFRPRDCLSRDHVFFPPPERKKKRRQDSPCPRFGRETVPSNGKWPPNPVRFSMLDGLPGNGFRTSTNQPSGSQANPHPSPCSFWWLISLIWLRVKAHGIPFVGRCIHHLA